MFRVKLTIGNAIQRLKAIPDNAIRIFRERIGTELPDAVQAQVLEIMAQEPGEPSSPFEFGSTLSARYYFWLITHFPGLSDGEHWIRTGDLEHSFQTEVSYSGLGGKITVFSTRPDAAFVYGPWQVMGHKNTGWGEQYAKAQKLILSYAKNLTFEIWDESVYQAAKEAGFYER